MPDIIDRVDEMITNLQIAAFHHGSFRPPSQHGRLRTRYVHTPSSQGKSHAEAREHRDRVMADLRASVARLRDVVSAAGALWSEQFDGLDPDDMTTEQQEFVSALGRLMQEDVGDTATIGASKSPVVCVSALRLEDV